MFWYILVGTISYLLGSINLAIILSKKMRGQDIRQLGSKSAGTTNTLRVLGKLPALATLLFDIGKGIIAICIAKLLSLTGVVLDPRLLIQIAAICAIIGHDYPIYYGFKGGKGVATSLGVILILTPKIALACLAFGLILIAITKMVSLGSISASILYPVLILFTQTEYIILAIIIAGIILIKHKANIKRILNGTESKLGEKV